MKPLGLHGGRQNEHLKTLMKFQRKKNLNIIHLNQI